MAGAEVIVIYFCHAKKMSLFLKRFRVYASLPEMRLVWFFVPVLGLLIGSNALFLPWWLALLNAGLFVLLASILFFSGLRLARSNLEIKVERNELSSIIDNLQDGVIAYDTDFRVLVFNHAAEAIFELSARDIVGKQFSPNFSKVTSERLAQAMFPSLAPMAITRSEPSDPVQIVDLSFENPKANIRVATAKVIDPAGKLLGFLKIISDRTRETAILRSKSEFITVAAHQLRTPLTAVQWTMEALQNETLSPSGKEFLGNGSAAAKKVLKIVNDLLDVAKIEEGRFGYEFQNADLISFFETILAEAAAFAQKYGVQIYFEKPEKASIPVLMDQSKLALAVNNLIDNAIKYNVKNGSVTVYISPVPDSPFVQIAVRDTGLGVPPDEAQKLFTKFFRAQNAVKVETEGSGLGLYIAKNIIIRHGGKIWVESELNRGTTIYFTLPTDPSLVHQQEQEFLEE